MADCGTPDNQKILYSGLDTLRQSQVVRGEINSIDPINNAANVTLLDQCALANDLDIESVPFDYLCEGNEERTAVALAEGYRAFSVGDIVYILVIQRGDVVEGYIIGEVDIKGTRQCVGEYILILAGGETAPAWAGGTYVDKYATIYDTAVGSVLAIDYFTNKDESSPAKPSSLPALYDAAFIAWFEYNFTSAPPGVLGLLLTVSGINYDGEGDQVDLPSSRNYTTTSGESTSGYTRGNESGEGFFKSAFREVNEDAIGYYYEGDMIASYYDNTATETDTYSGYAGKTMSMTDADTLELFKYRIIFDGQIQSVYRARSSSNQAQNPRNYLSLEINTDIALSFSREWVGDTSYGFSSFSNTYSIARDNNAGVTTTDGTYKKSTFVPRPIAVAYGQLGLYVLVSGTMVIEAATNHPAIPSGPGSKQITVYPSGIVDVFSDPQYISTSAISFSSSYVSTSTADVAFYNTMDDLDFQSEITCRQILDRTTPSAGLALGQCVDEMVNQMIATHGLAAYGVTRDGIEEFSVFARSE